MRKPFSNKDHRSRRLTFNSLVSFDYWERPPMGAQPVGASPTELILLLHGFNETGARIFSKLSGLFDDHHHVLSPCGMYPIPNKVQEGYKVGYSWYFYDPLQGEYFIDQKMPADYLLNGLRHLNLLDLPTRIVGFSQGGYLAPFLAARLPQAKQVIGFGCEYLWEEWPENISFRIDGLHGKLDDVVSVESSERSFSEIARRYPANPGRFHVLEQSGHRFDDQAVKKIGELVKCVP